MRGSPRNETTGYLPATSSAAPFSARSAASGLTTRKFCASRPAVLLGERDVLLRALDGRLVLPDAVRGERADDAQHDDPGDENHADDDGGR